MHVDQCFAKPDCTPGRRNCAEHCAGIRFLFSLSFFPRDRGKIGGNCLDPTRNSANAPAR